MKLKDNKRIRRVQKEIVNKPLFYLILVTILIRLFYLSMQHPLWWDSHVYIGMGKFIFSQGNIGIWESFRPLVHPIIIGAFWKLNLNPIIIGKLLDLIFSTTAVYLTYLVGKQIFNKTVGLISALIFSLTSVFIMFTGLILTEPLAITLALLGIYFYLREEKTDKEQKNKNKNNNAKSYFLLTITGLFLGLSFMTKFPQGILFGALALILLIRKTKLIKKIKDLFSLTFGFLISVLPYMVFNYFKYPNLLEPFISGSQIVTTSTWVYGTGITFYLTNFFLRYWIYLFFFAYIYLYFKEKHWQDDKKNFILITITLFLLYFIFQVPRKEVRYLVTILPLLTTLAAYAIITIYKKLKSTEKPTLKPYAFVIICILITIVHVPTALYAEKVPTFEQEILILIDEYNITNAIMTTDPSFVSFIDQPIIILSAGLQFGPKIYEREKGNYGLLFINNCDFICAPNNNTCLGKKDNFVNLIFSENKEIFRKTVKGCTYSIALPKSQNGELK
jgi:4-amino-4-deoxy-L-arabinose transferase-like glycosyltransferase